MTITLPYKFPRALDEAMLMGIVWGISVRILGNLEHVGNAASRTFPQKQTVLRWRRAGRHLFELSAVRDARGRISYLFRVVLLLYQYTHRKYVAIIRYLFMW